ncbi:2374_t:CDS:2, partial [Funneliformis mosseae]
NHMKERSFRSKGINESFEIAASSRVITNVLNNLIDNLMELDKINEEDINHDVIKSDIDEGSEKEINNDDKSDNVESVNFNMSKSNYKDKNTKIPFTNINQRFL